MRQSFMRPFMRPFLHFMRAPLLTTLIIGFISFAPALAPTQAHAMSPHETALPSTLASKALLLDVTQIGKRLVAVGAHGHIIYSDNGGTSWQQAKDVPTRNTLSDVSFLIDDKTGFAVGHSASILRTRDGGETWQMVYSERRGEDALFGIHFITPQHGIAVGAFGRLLETHDGGETWQARLLNEDSADDFHLNAIFGDRRGDIYITAEAGNVYKSTDQGKSFTHLKTPYVGSFWNGMALDTGDILIWGMRGNAFYTRDGGRNWIKSNTNTDRSISGGTQLKSGQIVLTGLSGLVLVSDDGGKNFAASVRSDRRSFATASAGSDSKTALLYGEPGVVSQPLP